MRKLFFLLIVAFAHTSYAQDVSFSITGNISGLSNAVKLHLYSNGQYQLYKTLDAKDGKFNFSGSLKEPQLALVEFSDSVKKNIFIGGEKMELTGNINDAQKIKVSGSPLSDAYNLFDETMVNPVRLKLINIASEMDKAEKHKDGSRLASLNESLSKTYNSLGDSTEKFIRQNPTSYVSLYLLREYKKMYKASLQKELLSLLDPSVKSFAAARELDESLQLAAAVSGRSAPPAAFTDINDQTVALNSLRGNYVLVVFWATWCVPCLQEMPHLKQAYSTLKDKKFKLIMLSLDKEKTKWTAVVKKFELNDFIHGNLPKDFDDPIAVNFNISSLPANCLIAPDGTIVAKNIPPDQIVNYLNKTVQ